MAAEAAARLDAEEVAERQLTLARQWYRSALVCGTPPDTPMVVQAWAYAAYPTKRLAMLARAMRRPR